MKETTVSEIMQKMIQASQGNLHDINHFLKVYAYARTIAQAESLSPAEQKTLEIAAILHDIACPLCREKYGNTNGKYQEAEGIPLAEAFLQNCCLSEEMISRIVYLVGHHHTLRDIDGIDYQILLEADYLVNADEAGYSVSNIRHTMESLFKTSAGTALLQSVYQL